MKPLRIWACCGLVATGLEGPGELFAAPEESSSSTAPEIAGIFELPRTSLSRLGNPACSEAVLQKAQKNGLKFTDRPSIGSGIAVAGVDEFVGVTDRGPNGMAEEEDGEGTRRTFPLPRFCPTVVRFKLAGGEIRITHCIPLTDTKGKLLTGLTNMKGEERLYESADAKRPLPLDPDGVDPEGIRMLPDGTFLLCEEYGPSVLVVSPKGEVLVRYTPRSKPLTKATYPVKAILPEIFAQRRKNHGFESVAVSRDGRWAYAILQSPMGDEREEKFRQSRVVRVLKMDLAEPLNARVAGEYLLLTSPAQDYSKNQKQQKISFSDADWAGPDRLLVAEHGKGQAKVLLADFSRATDVLNHPDSEGLSFEQTTDLSARGLQPAETKQVFSTRNLPGITSDKIEGIAYISPDRIALANDNDFGIGPNVTGEPSMVWMVRVPALAALLK